MNPYIQNLNRIEFALTYACTGRCKHCSEGEHADTGVHIDGAAAADLVLKTARAYQIDSLMTFGGEPLLCLKEVCLIHAAAREAGIPRRELITNGFFSREEAKIRRAAEALAESGVNRLMLSADAFHQETIPPGPVMQFAKAACACGIPQVWVHPAWLVSPDAENPYNQKTREILNEFHAAGIACSAGNVVFPSGNALKYLHEYFDLSQPQVSPYAENPRDITAICVNPHGDVLGGNIYETDILDILAGYTPGV